MWGKTYRTYNETVKWWLEHLNRPVLKSMDYADLREFSKTCPNPLHSDFTAETDPMRLSVPLHPREDMFAYLSAVGMISCADAQKMLSATYQSMFQTEFVEEEAEQEPEREQFEINLTEPLVGWRHWTWSKPAMSAAVGLRSLNVTKLWKPCEAFEAKCHLGWPRNTNHRKDLVPTEDCTCGIYAVDGISDLPVMHRHSGGEELITGLVYGWGRYVRGENGWRAQFAYPAEFHLRSFQTQLIEPLKEFRVPILIDEPIKIYDPSEDGYENRQDD
jgi:hypothetical protein